ncbi:hypothetical protein NQ317_004783 [Molorchus minor]|uniref:Uncharacterized protein n=1 Tax=Molorchus minor TaxID=1323400 RepID=A0ABQ9JWU9_9CUCU|nr:hypothetical protein NQ317_004783 [Molorchus minor]
MEKLVVQHEKAQTSKRKKPPRQEGNQEWKKFVGSIRRKVQKHASGSSDVPVPPQPKGEPLSRKNSLTSKFEMFKREKSCDERKDKKSDKQPLTKQKSIGPEGSTRSDLFKALSFRDKSKSVSVKQIDTLVTPKLGDFSQKGVRKSDKKDSTDKTHKSSISLSRSKEVVRKNKEGLRQDDFLKATMRIFLVVSPPSGKVQTNVSLFFLLNDNK